MNRTIAYLTSVYARAGDTFIRREVQELRRQGWTVHTFSIRRADEAEGVAEDIRQEQARTDYILERGPWRLAASFLRTAFRSPGRLVRAARQCGALRWPGLRSWVWHLIYLLEACYLAEQLRRKDVAYLHNHISMNSATVAALASTLSGVPFGLTVHGPHDFFAPEQWALGEKIAAAALTVCISSYGRSQCMLFAGSQHWPKLHVVHCGLDGEFLAPPPPSPPAQTELVCIGRLGPEKGQALLVEAVARLRDEGLEARVVLVGDGPSRAAIESRARELGVEDRIRLAGWQGSGEVRRLILESRALVLPSLAEGIPVVLMEALALCRPVIATYVGGIPELVEPGASGWLVPAGAVEPLALAMRQALTLPVEELRRMGEVGRQRVLAEHDVVTEARKLSRLFEGAVGR